MPEKIYFLVVCIFLCCKSIHCCISNGEKNCLKESDAQSNLWTDRRKYILYDINPGEGFNLRRDVYLRLSVFLYKLLQEERSYDWILVLPPWGPMYHWRTNITAQAKIQWSSFFDVPCLNNFIPVMELSEFLQSHGPEINTVYYLQQDDWEKGNWEDKLVVEKCKKTPPYREKDNLHFGWFWGFEEIFARNILCVTVLGDTSLLKELVVNSTDVTMIDRAEVVLHDGFGDHLYWQARQSMRFSKQLREIGDAFRQAILNSTDEADKTVLTNDCGKITTKQANLARGGSYIGAHLRRRDFVLSRGKEIPSLDTAARHLKTLQYKLGVSTIFLATDAPQQEIEYLKNLVPEMVYYVPSDNILHQIKDGGVAIVDQWICAHAHYFIGSHESTFSFRIQEEREILGFHPDTTFNRFCGDAQENCEQPARWRIAYN